MENPSHDGQQKMKKYLCIFWKWIKENPGKFFIWLLVSAISALFVVFMLVIISDKVANYVCVLLDAKNKNEALKFIGIGMGGLLAAIGAIAVNRRADAQVKNNKLVEKGHIQDRFKAATEHLGHRRAGMRIAAYYEFYQLAQDNKNLRKNIFDMLCAHLRQITNSSDYKGIGKPTEGVQTLLDLLFKSEDKSIFQGLKADLRRVNLAGADLVGAHMPNTDFTNACLIGANMRLADLHASRFIGTEMYGAALQDAKIPFGLFIYTKLNGSNISSANFQGSRMVCADFRGACCDNVYMQLGFNILPPGNPKACMGGVFCNEIYDGYVSVIRRHVGIQGNVGEIHFYDDCHGLFKFQIKENSNFIRKYVGEKEASKYDKYMEIHEDNRPHDIKHGIVLDAYTEKDADKWIKEYQKAMGKKNENN